VERHLAANPDDRGVWPLKQLLYHDLTEADYDAAAGGPDLAVTHFDHAYAQQLGLAPINDPVRWPRGAAVLRIAARARPPTAPAHRGARPAGDGADHLFPDRRSQPACR